MGITAYASAIRDAVKRGELSEMKDLLRYALELREEQGDLDGAIHELHEAIRNLEK